MLSNMTYRDKRPRRDFSLDRINGGYGPRDHSTDSSFRSDSPRKARQQERYINLPPSMKGPRIRNRSMDITNMRGGRSSDFSVNSIERLRTRPRILVKEDNIIEFEKIPDVDKIKNKVETSWTKKSNEQQKPSFFISKEDDTKSNTYSWRKDIEYLEEGLAKINGWRNQNKENTTMKDSKKIYIPDNKNNTDPLRITTIKNNNLGDNKYEKNLDRSTAADSKRLSKISSWRKDIEKFEDDLQLSKIRKETQKKIDGYSMHESYKGHLNENKFLTKSQLFSSNEPKQMITKDCSNTSQKDLLLLQKEKEAYTNDMSIYVSDSGKLYRNIIETKSPAMNEKSQDIVNLNLEPILDSVKPKTHVGFEDEKTKKSDISPFLKSNMDNFGHLKLQTTLPIDIMSNEMKNNLFEDSKLTSKLKQNEDARNENSSIEKLDEQTNKLDKQMKIQNSTGRTKDIINEISLNSVNRNNQKPPLSTKSTNKDNSKRCKAKVTIEIDTSRGINKKKDSDIDKGETSTSKNVEALREEKYNKCQKKVIPNNSSTNCKNIQKPHEEYVHYKADKNIKEGTNGTQRNLDVPQIETKTIMTNIAHNEEEKGNKQNDETGCAVQDNQFTLKDLMMPIKVQAVVGKGTTSEDKQTVEITETEENIKSKDIEGNKDEGEQEDFSGMRAMRKETGDRFLSMEAEFEEGRSKLAAVRTRIRRAREMAALK